ncbi:MAG TPA: SDR family oxidoreductase [Deltaproteobacteria bacterium]|nr:SDR family oxidoreductase [Deltaproteobacteria bacterium]HQI82775.1 SDR family oxidoreductase [Deltaproteobacteria bacterium]
MAFTDKVVWITGASSGIGEALAYALSKQGSRLILSSRNVQRLGEVKAGCASAGSHLVLPLDLEDSTAFDDAVAQALARFGRIDVLINCGGISQRGLASDTTMETLRKIMETDFFGTVALTKAVLPSMIRNRSGHIVVISSLMGKFSTPLRSGYCASKHALHGYFDALRAELRDKGIRVTIVCPGFIRTGISVNALCADGTCHGVMDEAQARGMSAAACADRILQGLGKGSEEILVGGREILGVYLKRFAPGLLSRIVARSKVT